MVIQALGANSFKIESGERSILINPPSNRFKANITLLTETKTADVVAGFGETPSEDGVILRTPGEYEAGGIEVTGVRTLDSDEKTIRTAYLVSWEEINFFISTASAIPEAAALEELEDADVALLAVGGDGLPGEKARELVKKIEPRIVVLSSAGKAKEFLSATGQKGELMDKLVFKKKDLENEKGRVVILTVA